MKKIVLFIYIFLITNILYLTNMFSDARPDTFRKYKNHYFIETGAFKGQGIQYALNARFQQIFSIEINKNHFLHCSKKFKNHANVHIFLGNSETLLWELIQNIDDTITFWLDAHWKGYAAILQELEQIKNHHIKNHTILIDDMRTFTKMQFGKVTKKNIIDKLLEINPNYSITYEHGVVMNDILVASIKKKSSIDKLHQISQLL